MNTILSGAFMVQTVSAVMTGVEAVQLDQHFKSAVDVVMLCSIILWANLEYFLSKDIFDASCADSGEVLVGVHLHPVFFMPEMKCHSCDVCMERIEDDGYRCKTCDFDVCLRCHARHRRESPPLGAAVGPSGGGGLSLGQFFCRSIQLALEFWPTLVAAMVCMLACQATLLAAPNLQGKIFDSIIKWDQQLFTHTVYVYLCVNLLQGFLAAVQSLTLNLVARRIRATVCRKLYVSIIGQDVSFFDATHTGNLTSRLSNDAAAMTNPCRTILNNLLANAVLLLGGAIMCFITNWRLGVLAATSMVPISYAYRLYAQWSRQVYSTIYQALGDANSVATESFSNIRTVRAFGAEDTEIGNYNEAVEVGLKAGVRSAVVGAGVYGYAKYIDLGTTVLILWYGGSAIFSGKGATLGTLVAFQLYWNMMNGAFNALSDVVNDLIRAASAAERVFNLMDKRPGIDPHEGREVDDIVGEIKIENLSFCYSCRPEKMVLKSIDLEMHPRTVTALVGRSGGGKSTLVHLLLRFYDPIEGRVLMDGIDYRQYRPSSLRSRIGLVAQDTQLFSTSVYKNLVYGLDRECSMEEVVSAARMANAHEFIEEMDEGYETRVGERGIRLSGGQKQRIAIARCFLRRPRVLLLDEATSALDTENEALVQAALDGLIATGGCTVILVAHRLSTVKNADMIAVISEGRVVEKGRHDELVGENGVYAKLVARQLSHDGNRLTVDEVYDNEVKAA
ncbi:ABC transporter, putative [Perkinsus marinus ATCC 50983]|uniref:ABC transporter, putative n=1 Tax=Perkinsus marinus (strain ATCC 50983 / TXsc) TaxID=423536 RepID=C5KNG4_PERM5|nr:ABC transporter, putative [Perkinsus marinus ATCC 50983]EER13979.1 ABC transporter, putative [Perkinsus marinus ATCC 50983]|eukprot:XP_002782184.1 ABC transporter, putative [Perkinsus marinus ATCC 50983]